MCGSVLPRPSYRGYPDGIAAGHDGLLHFIDPGYVNVLFEDRLGQYMLIMAAVMQILGG